MPIGEHPAAQRHGIYFQKAGRVLIPVRAEGNLVAQPPARPYGNGICLWFELDDFDAAVARAEEMKTEVIKPRHRSKNAHWECWLRELEGYTIVLAGPHGSAGKIE